MRPVPSFPLGGARLCIRAGDYIRHGRLEFRQLLCCAVQECLRIEAPTAALPNPCHDHAVDQTALEGLWSIANPALKNCSAIQSDSADREARIFLRSRWSTRDQHQCVA